MSVIREIGFDTEMWADGKCQETIFFLAPHMSDDPPGGRRYKSATREELMEFIGYWENQIAVAREYMENGFNPHTHEWKPQGEK